MNVEITLRHDRCTQCNRWWAHERVGNYPYAARCPHCCNATIDELRSQIETLVRSNAALRGIVNKQKRGGS